MFFSKMGGSQFEAREIGIHELDHWREFPHFSGSKEVWHPDLPHIRRLIEARAAFAYVVEDSVSRTVVAYKVTLFTSPDFARCARTFAAEHRAGKALDELVSNRACVMRPQQIAFDNSGAGLTAVSLGAWNHNIRDPQRFNDLGRTLEKCVIHAHAGFKLREFLLYACSAEHARYIEQGGALMCGSTGGAAPYLLGVTREQASELYGRTVAALFDHHAPILSLSEPCRDLLICALSGGSDEEAARALHISVAAVKKRWESLFATAGVKLPHLFRENPYKGRRGPERRTSLISYIRQHPEELRPTISVKGSSRSDCQ